MAVNKKITGTRVLGDERGKKRLLEIVARDHLHFIPLPLRCSSHPGSLTITQRLNPFVTSRRYACQRLPTKKLSTSAFFLALVNLSSLPSVYFSS